MNQSQGEALEILCRAFPDGSYQHWGQCEVLMPHVQAVLRHGHTTGVSRLQRSKLLCAVAFYDREQGRYTESYEKYTEASLIQESVLGKEHADVMSSYLELGSLQCLRGEYVSAEDMYRKAHNLSTKMLGEEHPETATCLNYIGGALWWQGKYEEAKNNQQLSLDLRRKTLGNEHRKTIRSLSDLAVCYEYLGDFATPPNQCIKKRLHFSVRR